MRFFLELSYNGSLYHGWQYQPNAVTVQEVLEQAISTLLKTQISIVGAGRTDTGVHASQMFAHFDYHQEIDVLDLIYRLNAFLPKSIAIKNILEVQPDAHARFDALYRTYHYKISTIKNVFEQDFAHEVSLPLDVDEMNRACDILMAYKDFQCFSKSNTDVRTYHCDIKDAYWEMHRSQLIFYISANRFLRNMVRAIVGTMINVGLGKLQSNDLHDIIASKDRSRAGFSVPAKGLYLVKIDYPESIKLK